ncbi:MAG: MoaD/ThiS family protein [Bacteroidales bacterium]|nr:MoaD/ThiS family protein [Bacteroidales bacterium]
MPHVQVRYFGAIAEITGKEQERIPFSGQLNVLLETLKTKYSLLQTADYQVSVNFTIIQDNPILNDGDEIALLPPFAGG